jgi:type IV pilus assembly protein PilC
MKFHFTALNIDNQKIESDIEGSTIDDAILQLQKKGLSILDIKEKTEGFDLSFIKDLPMFKEQIKTKDVVIFSRQIATLFEAGVSALKGFRLLAQENDNKMLQKQLVGVSDDIESGISLSEALSRRPLLFSTFYVNMVKSGEETGKLNEVFLYLADYLDREYELNQKIKKALTYPTFVISTFFAIMVAMLTFVVPKMAALFAEQGTELPFVTRLVLGLSNLFVHYGPITFPTLGVLGYIYYRWSITPEGKYQVDTVKLKIPAIKSLYKQIFLTRLSDNMNTMLSSGVPIVRALEITGSLMENMLHQELLKRVAGKVQTGTSFSKALYEEESVPNILVQMVSIGEETGELGYILKNLATFYKRELDTAIDNVIGLIEPAMIVGLGLGVGVLVSAVLLPMYSLSDSISYLDVIEVFFS